LDVYFTEMSAEPATHDVGGWPPTVSMRKTLEARAPCTLLRANQSTLVVGAAGEGMSPTLAARMNAVALPAVLPVDVKSHLGEMPVPEGEVTK